ncbi:MAG: hypothetical protein ACP5FK_09395 [bacterium]
MRLFLISLMIIGGTVVFSGLSANSSNRDNIQPSPVSRPTQINYSSSPSQTTPPRFMVPLFSKFDFYFDLNISGKSNIIFYRHHSILIRPKLLKKK